jgi:hypothetical protein
MVVRMLSDYAVLRGQQLRVPRDDGHRFHGMMGTDSTRRWAAIPRDRGQV